MAERDPSDTEQGRSLLERAFATGATDLQIRSRAPFFDDYEATVSAFVHHQDGPRMAAQMASATGRGSSPQAALEDALTKLQAQPELAAPGSAIEGSDTRRYAVPGRPGEFVTREEALGEPHKALE